MSHSTPPLKYDNVRESASNGADWGVIVEGKVVRDPVTGERVVLDEDGVAFSMSSYLEALLGKDVRVTCVSMESAEKMGELLKSLQSQQGGQ